MKSPYQELAENNSECDLIASPHPNNTANDAVVLSAVNDVDDQNDNHTKLQQKEEIKVEQGSEKGETSSPTLQGLDNKIKILQNSIESIKELFLHVIEKVNHVNQENEFLRNMLIQQNSGIATDFSFRQANQLPRSTNNVSYPVREESSFQLENQLPYLNQAAMHLNDQLYQTQRNAAKSSNENNHNNQLNLIMAPSAFQICLSQDNKKDKK